MTAFSGGQLFRPENKDEVWRCKEEIKRATRQLDGCSTTKLRGPLFSPNHLIHQR